MSAVQSHRMSIEEFLALPDEEGVSRWLIDGVLREERGGQVTRRSRVHSYPQTVLAHRLLAWLEHQPEPRGEVHSGEIGFILHREAGISVGLDVAYIDADTAAAQGFHEGSMIEGVPVLAAEVLSPSDRQREIDEKIDAYLRVGIAHVWMLNPHRRSVTHLRTDRPSELMEPGAILRAEPALPGLEIPVAELFL